MTDLEPYCAGCGRRVELERKAGRRDECAHCGAELHACVNCEHYDADRTPACREPNAHAEEAIRDATRANYCQWFDHRRGPPRRASPGTSDKAAFEALFSSARPAPDVGRAAAEDAFAKLFKR